MAKDIREENAEYLSRLSKRKISRVIAWICLLIIAALIIATFITGIMGSKLFLPFLALTITIPFFMYIALWLGKVLSGAGRDVQDNKND
ncbi:MAG: hypothetical protein IJ054_10675 [Lachnospiraceae bacterium]|nr:hypothetical protein [Lachnospiraceae bacterium]MBQ9232986.1 hypothetical protein [Lachnospiraceae bacterium]